MSGNIANTHEAVMAANGSATDRRQAVRLALGALLVPAVTALAGCARPSYSLNYILKLVVSVAGVEHVAEGVFKVDWYLTGPLAHFDGLGLFTADASGEAVPLDLGEKGLLFALARPTQSGHAFDASRISLILSRYLPPADSISDQAITSGQMFRDCARVLRQEVAVAAQYWPALIRFENIHDPKSAQLVKPDMFEDVYGLGSSVRSVTVRITDKSVTHVVERYLPWLKDTAGAFSHETGPASQASTAAQITRENFQLSEK